MKHFKFLNDNIYLDEPYGPEIYNPPPVDRLRPIHYYRTNLRRDDIPEEVWYNILRQQRQRLIERLWQEGMISHTIVYQDENGLTMSTEILL